MRKYLQNFSWFNTDWSSSYCTSHLFQKIQHLSGEKTIYAVCHFIWKHINKWGNHKVLRFQESQQTNCSVIRLWQHQMNRHHDNITKNTKLLSPWHEVPFTTSIRNEGLNLYLVSVLLLMAPTLPSCRKLPKKLVSKEQPDSNSTWRRSWNQSCMKIQAAQCWPQIRIIHKKVLMIYSHIWAHFPMLIYLEAILSFYSFLCKCPILPLPQNPPCMLIINNVYGKRLHSIVKKTPPSLQPPPELEK